MSSSSLFRPGFGMDFFGEKLYFSKIGCGSGTIPTFSIRSERNMAEQAEQAGQAGVPVFKLYGEQEPWPTPDMVHCEAIAARSRLHNWQIRPHQHHGLF